MNIILDEEGLICSGCGRDIWHCLCKEDKMKETGIIMSGNHPKLILDGIKTMTRRTWGLEFINKSPGSWKYVWDSVCQQHRFYDYYYTDAPPIVVKCPYGQVGDRLWVRETFCKECYGKDAIEDTCYKEDLERHHHDCVLCKWTPSIFMPRWASRITLEITEVRVERLQEITGEDIRREGHQPFVYPIGAGKDIVGIRELGSAQTFQWFMGLWDSLNAKRGYGWEVNPWVWVISFKREEGG